MATDHRPRLVGQTDAIDSKAHATSIVKEGDTWLYGKEIPIAVSLNALEAKPLGGNVHLYWSGIAVTVDRRALPEGSFLSAALAPASELWQTKPAPFLPAMPDPEDYTALQSAAEFGTLRNFPYDPFQQDPDRLTARIDDPFRLPWESGTVHGDGFLKGRSPNRSNPKKARWCFGICPKNPENIIDQIFAHYDTKLLLMDAEDGTISRRFRRNNATFDVIQPGGAAFAAGDGFSEYFDAEQYDNTRKYARTLTDYDEGNKVAAERPPVNFPKEFAEPVLRTAIRQALAGRDHRNSKQTLRRRIREHFSDLLQDFHWREARREGY